MYGDHKNKDYKTLLRYIRPITYLANQRREIQ